MYIIRTVKSQLQSSLSPFDSFLAGFGQKMLVLFKLLHPNSPKASFNQFIKAENTGALQLTTLICIQQKLTFCLLSNHLDPVLLVFFIDLCFKLCVINQVSCIAFVPILQLRLLYEKCINKSESNHEKTSNRLHEKTCSHQTCRNRKQRKFKSISQI